MKRVPTQARRATAFRATAWTLAALAGVAIVSQVRPLAFSSTQALATLGVAYTQDFNTLATTGTTNALTLTGWSLLETGTSANNNNAYQAGTGSGNAGDMYAFGAAASTERALGTLRSGTLVPSFGAKFTNNTGATITSLEVSYTGEQWRAGLANRGAADRLDFQYSLDATTLGDGTWTDQNELDFSSPNMSVPTAGALDGNAAANRTAISFTITGLSLASGSAIAIRWTDFDITSSDDGLSVDDFSITPQGSGGGTPTNPTLGTPSVSPAPVEAGNSVTIMLSAFGGANPSSTGFAVVADITPIGGAASAAFRDDGLAGDAIAGDKIYALRTTVAVGTSAGAKLIAITASDNEGRSATTSATVTVTAPVVTMPIHAIQGNGATSPFNAQVVTTTGIVTATKSNGFFLQTPDADADADPLTSEGIFVFTSTAPPAAAAVGNAVQVTGTVSEFASANAPGAFPLTELVSPTLVLLSSGNPLPSAATLSAIDTPVGSTATFYPLEKYEGMLVVVPSLTVVAPTEGSTSETNATGASNGVFYGVITGLPRPFREPGIDTFLALPAGAGANVPRWDFNLERIRVDSDALTGLTAADADVAVGDVITNITGVLDYNFRAYTILPTIAIPSNTALAAVAIGPARSDEVRIASLNLERFFDATNDPNIGDPVLTATAFNNRLNKAMLTVRDVLRLPDVLGTVEVENLSTLQALASYINTNAGTSYQAYLVEGNDVGGIDVGFLVNAATTTVTSVTQFGLATTYTNPNTGLSEMLNDRPPLVLEASAQPAGHAAPIAFTVIVNHLRSLNGVDDETAVTVGVGTEGDRVRAKRAAQAEYLAELVQDRLTVKPTEKIILVGDFNAFQFNDGYVDSMGTIVGSPAPADKVTHATQDLLSSVTLTNLVEADDPAEQYSFVFDGSAQVLDHVLVTPSVLPLVTAFEHGRSNSGFPEAARSNAATPLRLSDHDAVVVRLSAAAPKISGALVAIDPARTYIDVRYTNKGGGNALATTISGVKLTTGVGSGVVTSSTALPISLGTLGPGDSVVVRYFLSIPPTVLKFSLSANGTFGTAAGNTKKFSSAQAVKFPAI